MEDLTARDHSNGAESDLFSRFESTIQDPKTNKIIKKALLLERAVNELLASDDIDQDEVQRRALQYQQYLERNWPLEGQTVSISGWLVDTENSSSQKLETMQVSDAVVVSEGMMIMQNTNGGVNGAIRQIHTFLKFGAYDGNKKINYLALPGDVHIQPHVQSPEHADALLKECYPGLYVEMNRRIEALYGQDDADGAVIDIFKDFMFEVDDDPEIDAELVQSIEKQLSHHIEFETEVPSYITATGPYYEEAEYVPACGIPGVHRYTSETPHDALVTPYKIAFRQSLEEDGLRMHIPMLECSVYSTERGAFARARQYPLRTIENITSIRDISYGTYNQREDRAE